ncbi:MAG: SUMF1/EgtB/PvdO family nonheme iron enzyme [Pseudomonadota bacterium]
MVLDPDKPHAFLSYTRSDDDYLEGGITWLHKALEKAVHARTGKPFQIFQDVEDIQVSDRWGEKLNQALAQAQLFIPVLTPSFFQSYFCLRETRAFLNYEKRTGRDCLILPVYLLAADELEQPERCEADELVSELCMRQRADWRTLAINLKHQETRYLAAEDVDALATSIRNALAKFEWIETIEEPDPTTPPHLTPGSDPNPTVIERITKMFGSQKTKTALIASSIAAIASGIVYATDIIDENETGDVFRDCSDICPELVVIPPGEFAMGSPGNEIDRTDHEGPQHGVTISESFALCRTEVTFAQWNACAADDERACSHKPAGEGKAQGNLPVVNVSWSDAQQYLRWLSRETGENYRLPSEAEWEYSARAGTDTVYPFGDSPPTAAQARFEKNMGEGATLVKSYDPNAFGLYDMYGNVAEWVEDRYHKDYRGAPDNGEAWLEGGTNERVIRGGNWESDADDIRSAHRTRGPSSDRDIRLGFRCARDL